MMRVNAIMSASGLGMALFRPSWAQEVSQLPTQIVTQALVPHSAVRAELSSG